MKRMLPACLSLVIALSARADVVELDNGQKFDGNVLSFSSQRFDVADKSGSISHFNLQRVKRIDFDSSTGMVVTRGRGTLHAQLIGLQDGYFILTNEKGEKQAVPAAETIDLTVSSKNLALATPPPTLPKPAPDVASSSRPRPQAQGSIQPEHGKITIVDFYADWCGPCRRIGPVLEQIAAGNPNIVLQKVNVDKHPDLAKEYHATAIPHIIIYDRNGGEVDTVIGANEPLVRHAIELADAK